MHTQRFLFILLLVACEADLEKGTDTSSGTETTIGDVCASEQEVAVDFQLASELFSEPHVSLDAIEWDCTVSLQESDADRLAVLMMCSDGEASGKTLLSISTAPDVPATVFPNQVKLHLVDRSNLNIHQWIRVETLSSDLVFAASMGYHPSPEGIEVARLVPPSETRL